MDFFQNTEPNADAEPDTFFILPLGFLIISLLLVDEEKFTRGLVTDSSTSDEQAFEFKFLPHFRPDLFSLVDPYTGESFSFSSSSFFCWLSFFSCSALISFLLACFSFSFFSSSSSFSLVFLHSLMYSLSVSLRASFCFASSFASVAMVVFLTVLDCD